MKNTLNFICSLLQIAGLFIICFAGPQPWGTVTLTLVGISGFAGFIKVFFITQETNNFWTYVGSIAGLMLVVAAGYLLMAG